MKVFNFNKSKVYIKTEMSCYFYQNKTDTILQLKYPCILYKQSTMQSTHYGKCVGKMHPHTSLVGKQMWYNLYGGGG